MGSPYLESVVCFFRRHTCKGRGDCTMNLIKRAGVYRELAILTAMLILTALLSFPARAEEAESSMSTCALAFLRWTAIT